MVQLKIVDNYNVKKLAVLEPLALSLRCESDEAIEGSPAFLLRAARVSSGSDSAKTSWPGRTLSASLFAAGGQTYTGQSW